LHHCTFSSIAPTILWNNSALTKQSNYFACGIPRPTRTQASSCGNTIAFAAAFFAIGVSNADAKDLGTAFPTTTATLLTLFNCVTL
jgi:hypothetical protein